MVESPRARVIHSRLSTTKVLTTYQSPSPNTCTKAGCGMVERIKENNEGEHRVFVFIRKCGARMRHRELGSDRMAAHHEAQENESQTRRKYKRRIARAWFAGRVNMTHAMSINFPFYTRFVGLSPADSIFLKRSSRVRNGVQSLSKRVNAKSLNSAITRS